MRAEIRHFHLFCGLGGGARGFNRGEARVGSLQAEFRCLGGIDVDAASVRDFERLSGTPGTALDLFDRGQYLDFHDHEPPVEWREATPTDIQRAAGWERPHILFTSPPCKGFSGLLSESRSSSARYQALNRLTVRGLWLALEAWRDDPPEFVLLENVPRIANRGAHLLVQIEALLHRYGYATAHTTHDCGELGGLAQSRKRFLLVARHGEKVPPFLYEPQKRPLRGVGTVLEKLPLPGLGYSGPMHRLPRLQWRTWVRLAFVEAGGDWRSLERLRVVDDRLADFAIAPDTNPFNGAYGVLSWSQPAPLVTGVSRPATGRYAVADPRYTGSGEYGQWGVKRWDEVGNAVSAQAAPGAGRYSVADPRMPPSDSRHHGKFKVFPWSSHAHCVTASQQVGSGAQSIADPRLAGEGRRYNNVYRVVPWNDPACSVTGAGQHDNGPWSIADPRALTFASSFEAEKSDTPQAKDRLVAVIRSMDDTWHRPFTTLELAALQGLVDPEEHLELEGASDSAWRERIGNAVPAPAAAAIASVMATTLLLAWTGKTFVLNAMPVWVRPVAVAIAVDTWSQH